MTVARAHVWWCCWLLAAVLVTGCGSSSSSPSSSSASKDKVPEFNVIRLYNDSTADIFDVVLSAGGTTSELNRLPAEHSPVSDRGVSPDPATATVSWRTGRGERFTRDVSIAKDLPPGFHGVIVLRLLETGEVAVKFVPYEELK